MKMLRKILVSILGLLLLLLLVFRFVGLDPHDRIPGLWLTGNVVTTPISDWSFTDKFLTIHVETRTWYGLPHSVTTSCLAHQGQLYLTSSYERGMQFPKDRGWNQNVVRDPHVRLQIGGQLYTGTLQVVTDPAERESVFTSRAIKYPKAKPPEGGYVHLFHFQQS